MVKERLDGLLLGILGSEDLVDIWWNTQNKAFDYETPKTTWLVDPRKVTNYILDQFIY